jgi:hypothetical protein
LLTVLDSDHQFDHGSGITMQDLRPTQIDNLVTLGRVWGFLKYHHPAVTSGQRHWDYELFRILPAVLDAKTRSAANAALVQWIDSLGPIPPCQPCSHLDTQNLELAPEIS